ncbi:MAG: amidophosphoribosyltransferase [Candidatus Aenigmarchaeota archaeon]|nr:amidophosphoribosyltransferase [Candidatus Aenigmarchaeota archaeon]
MEEQQISRMIYNGLITLQHRGQESAGIATLNGNDMHMERKMGLVSRCFSENSLSALKGNTGIGHVRYSTTGSSCVSNIQPFKVSHPMRGIAFAHNGNLVNYVDLKGVVSGKGRQIETTCDAELITHLLSDHLMSSNDIESSLVDVMSRVEGSYSAGMMTGEGDLVAFRDPNGFKPLCYGKNCDTCMFASESVAMDINGIDGVSDVNPGEMVILHKDGDMEKKQMVKPDRKHCMFEWVYFSRVDSVIGGRSVYNVRKKLGENLAKNFTSEADVVIPVPDTARPAAQGISDETGIPLAEGLIKNKYIYRTFIMPVQKTRDISVRMKLNPIKSVIKDKHVLLVDDSIVRGTTSRNIISMLKRAGARKVDFWVTCPPIISPCFYGIDISRHSELIAANHTIPEIKREIGVEKLCYQTIDGLVDAVGLKKSYICMACLTGEYPTPMAQKISDRMKTQKTLGKRYWEMES